MEGHWSANGVRVKCELDASEKIFKERYLKVVTESTNYVIEEDRSNGRGGGDKLFVPLVMG